MDRAAAVASLPPAGRRPRRRLPARLRASGSSSCPCAGPALALRHQLGGDRRVRAEGDPASPSPTRSASRSCCSQSRSAAARVSRRIRARRRALPRSPSASLIAAVAFALVFNLDDEAREVVPWTTDFFQRHTEASGPADAFKRGDERHRAEARGTQPRRRPPRLRPGAGLRSASRTGSTARR